MIRKKNLYKKPMKPFEKERIKEEEQLKKKYALKNKKELWKTQAKVEYCRGRAKALAKKPLEEQEILFRKLKALGLNTNTIADVLDLQVEDILKRRLPTVVAQKKLADTTRQARQMVVHKKILINKKVVNSPSYLVPLSEENKITLKKKAKKPKPKKEEAPAAEPQAEQLAQEPQAEAPAEPAKPAEPTQEEAPKEESKEATE
ncbi:MAG: 30S ribosomal protein S4 [Nanoarchaeota archaeon]|nr:30S ribosomal protein S4 [Nanoarchaeota archaeon]MBU1051426.1 30S ribosomal protein S4 [Nanoarchaeota archaeon]MBU1988077.1 30S ribosomal protein S4 [Nanoarchaeota archaeon]